MVTLEAFAARVSLFHASVVHSCVDDGLSVIECCMSIGASGGTCWRHGLVCAAAQTGGSQQPQGSGPPPTAAAPQVAAWRPGHACVRRSHLGVLGAAPRHPLRYSISVSPQIAVRRVPYADAPFALSGCVCECLISLPRLSAANRLSFRSHPSTLFVAKTPRC